MFSDSEPATELGPLPVMPLAPCTIADPKEYSDEKDSLFESVSGSVALEGLRAASGRMNVPEGVILRFGSCRETSGRGELPTNAERFTGGFC